MLRMLSSAALEQGTSLLNYFKKEEVRKHKEVRIFSIVVFNSNIENRVFRGCRRDTWEASGSFDQAAASVWL